MTNRIVGARVIWAMLAMEAGLALPIVSVPAQGDRLPGLVGAYLLLLLLPAGYLAVRELEELHDPAWRLLAGVLLALGVHAVTSSVAGPGLGGILLWLGRGALPVALGVVLWWRGGGLVYAEPTALEVRTEFGLLAMLLVAVLGLYRGLVSNDPLLLATAVGLFSLGGLAAVALARQDAAQVAAPGRRGARGGGVLALVLAALPLLGGFAVVSAIHPGTMRAFWYGLGTLIELLLMPIFLLLGWLASLLPQGQPGQQQPVPAPPSLPRPDPSALARAQNLLPEWLPLLVYAMVFALVAAFALAVVRLLLSDQLEPRPGPPRQPTDVTVEAAGDAREDAQALLGWLAGWFRRRLGRRHVRAGGGDAERGRPRAEDAWAVYRRLLEWAAQQGLARRPAETAGQLRQRLSEHAPPLGGPAATRDGQAPPLGGRAPQAEWAEWLALVTETYEAERYGEIPPPPDRLQRLQQALRHLERQQPGP